MSVDSNNAVQRALTNLKTGIEESGAIITVDALPVVTADESRLLQNLVGNAIKYRNGTPHIHVFCRHMEDIARAAAGNRHGPGWLFSVQDDGIGIDQQYFDRIFQAFERLHSRRKYPGTGMGLAICKRIVERHGGSIWVSSEPGKGSTSYFTLPDAVGNAGPEAEESLMNRN